MLRVGITTPRTAQAAYLCCGSLPTSTHMQAACILSAGKIAGLQCRQPSHSLLAVQPPEYSHCWVPLQVAVTTPSLLLSQVALQTLPCARPLLQSQVPAMGAVVSGLAVQLVAAHKNSKHEGRSISQPALEPCTQQHGCNCSGCPTHMLWQ